MPWMRSSSRAWVDDGMNAARTAAPATGGARRIAVYSRQINQQPRLLTNLQKSSVREASLGPNGTEIFIKKSHYFLEIGMIVPNKPLVSPLGPAV